MNIADRQLAIWLSLLTFAAYAYFHAGGGWNQNSQFDLTRAIVERHTFAIDAYAVNTGDVSQRGGHVYSNKSPGLSIIGALPYSILHALEKDPDDPLTLALNHYVCTILIVALLGALVPAILYRIGRQHGLSAPWSASVAISVALATQLLPYATFFATAVPSGALMLVALAAERRALGGFAAGLATMMNYVCAPAVILIGLVRPRKVEFFAGAVPPLISLAIYQKICFGSFFRTSIADVDARFRSSHAAFGVFEGPSLEAFYGITVSPYRGLFHFAPVLITALGGFILWFRSREDRRTLAAIVAISAIFFLVNVSFNGWEGGFGIGARYLVPLIPLWGLAMLRLRGWLRPFFAVLAVISFAFNFAAVAVDPQPSGTIPRPLTQYIFPLLVHGHFSPNVPITPPWSAATFTGHTSVNRMTHDEAIVFERHPPGSDAAEWASFNLGEPFFGPGDARSLIPIALVILAGLAAVGTKARSMRQS
jgi:hypothetical protein